MSEQSRRRCHRIVFNILQHVGMLECDADLQDELQASTLQINHCLSPRRPLRLTVVTETWPPEVNGVATTLACLVEGLQTRKHLVQLVRVRQSAQDQADSRTTGLQEVLMRGVPIPRYPHLRMGLPARQSLLRLWSTQRPDAVHIATEGPLGFSALLAAHHLRLPVSSDFRTNFPAYSRHYGVGWLRKPIMGYLRKFHNRCALTLVPTDALRRELQSAGFRQVCTLSRGVDTQHFHPDRRSMALRAQWGLADDQLAVGCVGRLAPEKNLGLVVAAFEAIAQQHPQARLVLVGDGPMRDELARRYPHAVLAGQRRGLDLAAHYASLDLFLFASLTETFGNVTSEAMASGLPVVAFRHAGAAQMIESGRQGELAPCEDPAEFTRAAVKLANDSERRRHLGLAARTRAELQDWGRIVLQFEHLLAQAAGLGHLPGRSASSPQLSDGEPDFTLPSQPVSNGLLAPLKR